MRKTLLIAALAVLLTASAYAGEMQYPVPAPPPQDPPSGTNALLVTAGEDAALDSFTQTVLNVLKGVLALV